MKTPILLLLTCFAMMSSNAQIEEPHITGNVPITFFGRVVDQSNQPVSGVRIDIGILIGYLISPTEGKQQLDKVQLTSDSTGHFTLRDVTGSSIQFDSIAKDGYKLSPKQVKAGIMYYPRPFYPDSNNPVVFKMWKQSGAETLLSSSWRGKVVCDGTSNLFDLLNGRRDTNGSLEINCTRIPLQLPLRTNAPFDYELMVKIHDGQIRATDDEFMYLASENGYVASVAVKQVASDPNWNGNAKQDFYFRTADGHYGCLTVNWYNWQTSPTVLEWNCHINPTGSRNLER